MNKINTAVLIDDDQIAIFGFKKIISKIDFCEELLTFNNGSDAINEIKRLVQSNKKIADIIFLDLNMPVMNGWSFLDNFSAIVPKVLMEKVTIYLLTSFVGPDQINKIRENDLITDFIEKPITIEKLRDIQNSML